MGAMSDTTRIKSGLPLMDALERYRDPHLWSRLQAAEDAVRAIGGIIIRGGYGSDKKAAVRRAKSDLLQDFGDQLRSGRLVAVGYVLRQGGRDPEAKRTRIPVDVFEDSGGKVDLKRSSVSGHGLEFVGIRVCLASEAPGPSMGLASARAECEAWIRQLSSDPDYQPRNKAELKEQALEKFSNLNGRIFDYAWSNVAPEAWKKPGRRKSRR
jgi:hypothetical protein